MTRTPAALGCLLAAASLLAPVLSAQPAVFGQELNDYEWSAVAPVVVSGVGVGEIGRLHEIVVDHVFRGTGLIDGQRVLVDIKRFNRSRDRLAHPDRVKLEPDVRYVFLLQPTESSRGEDPEPVYWLVRGVEGVRELPAEGAAARIAALEAFVAIQDLDSYPATWERMRRMLEETNPVMLSTALQQYIKFRKGDVELLPLLRPLLAHPRDDIRADAATLIGMIVDLRPADAIPDGDVLRAELAGLARRDRSEKVRIAGTEALAAFASPAAYEILEEIADSDPEQQVRYTAEKLLLQAGRDGR